MFELVSDSNNNTGLSENGQRNTSNIENHPIYCNVQQIDKHCLSLSVELLACSRRGEQFFTPAIMRNINVDYLRLYPADTLVLIWTIAQAFILSALTLVMARLVLHTFAIFRQGCWCRFMVEFLMIAVPQILCVNVFNAYIKYFVMAMLLIICVLMHWRKFWPNVQNRAFYFGNRPNFLTLYRANIYISSILCILAIDLKNFPLEYHKSRGYGVGMMDAGIGFFVFSMGIVSHRLRNIFEIKKILIPISILLLLGLARTMILQIIDYHQDEHEYGKHLNAFFILGFTKLFGSLLSLLPCSDSQLLAIGLGVLSVHEFWISNGLNSFVMNLDIPRTTFVTANREGLSSLLGYTSLYLLALFARYNLQIKQGIHFRELTENLKSYAIVMLFLWLAVVFSTFIFGIARVVCNFGYVCWILASAVTFIVIFIIAYDVILDTILPWQTDKEYDDCLQKINVEYVCSKLPLTVQAINYNGLVYFLVGNILTGLVNIFLDTSEVSDMETFVILLIYMFIMHLLMLILYKMKIRIA